jgi:hypothetical protein
MLIEHTEDFLIRCDNPERIDEVLRPLSAALLVYGWNGRYVCQDGCYVMRSFGDPESLRKKLRGIEDCEVVGECRGIQVA